MSFKQQNSLKNGFILGRWTYTFSSRLKFLVDFSIAKLFDTLAAKCHSFLSQASGVAKWQIWGGLPPFWQIWKGREWGSKKWWLQDWERPPFFAYHSRLTSQREIVDMNLKFRLWRHLGLIFDDGLLDLNLLDYLWKILGLHLHFSAKLLLENSPNFLVNLWLNCGRQHAEKVFLLILYDCWSFLDWANCYWPSSNSNWLWLLAFL